MEIQIQYINYFHDWEGYLCEEYIDDFVFTGRSQYINRELRVEIRREVKKGFIFRGSEIITEFVKPDNFRVIS